MKKIKMKDVQTIQNRRIYIFINIVSLLFSLYFQYFDLFISMRIE